ncbi:MAG: hypothetical protein RL417_1178 [Pseudomonadota bacterium]|jgi:acyl-CoA dehydrogenase
MADTSFLSWPFFVPEHRLLVEQAGSWAKGIAGAAHAAHGEENAVSKKLVQKLGEAGWLKYSVPGRFGGALKGLEVRSLCLLRETFGWHSGLLDFAFAMQGLGSGPLSLFGSEDLKARFLPEVAAGKKIAAFALSESAAGSDVAALGVTATKDGADFVVNGEKAWISNAGIADFYVVFARTGEGPGAKGLSAFLIEADARGLSTIKTEVLSPHPLGRVQLDNVRVPSAHLIGELGGGFKIAMGTLDVFRSTVGAAALGFARRALDEAVCHAKGRKLFGESLADFQLTQGKIADMAVEIDASALLVYRAAWAKDTGADRVTREAAMAKLYATEAAQRTIDQAVQIFGGLGVVSGSAVEMLYRDIRPLRIYEGTSEVQKLIIAAQVLKG